MKIPEHRVFISGPFTAPTDWKRRENIRRAQEVGLAVARLGGAPFIPHANTGAMFGELPEEFFLGMCYTFLDTCSALVTVSGWQDSHGSCAEVDFARKQLIYVFHPRFFGSFPLQDTRDTTDKITLGELLQCKRTLLT